MHNACLMLKRNLVSLCTKGAEDPAKFLKFTAALGWVLSCMAQVGAIVINDKIPTKEKKFLIPQEITDGIVNVSLFWFVTSKAESLGKIAVLSGRVMTDTIAKVDKKLLQKGAKLTLNSNPKELTSLYNEMRANINEVCPAGLKRFESFYKGFGTMVSLAGSVIAGNILTPIVRNKLAAVSQKSMASKTPENLPVKPIMTNPPNPSPVNYFSLAQNHYSNMKV